MRFDTVKQLVLLFKRLSYQSLKMLSSVVKQVVLHYEMISLYFAMTIFSKIKRANHNDLHASSYGYDLITSPPQSQHPGCPQASDPAGLAADHQ